MNTAYIIGETMVGPIVAGKITLRLFERGLLGK
jgi:hypothetical protein